jgi:hypothetical protein
MSHWCPATSTILILIFVSFIYSSIIVFFVLNVFSVPLQFPCHFVS